MQSLLLSLLVACASTARVSRAQFEALLGAMTAGEGEGEEGERGAVDDVVLHLLSVASVCLLVSCLSLVPYVLSLPYFLSLCLSFAQEEVFCAQISVAVSLPRRASTEHAPSEPRR